MNAPQPLHIGQVLSAQARRQPNATAVRDLNTQLTFQQWNQRSNRLGHALLGRGLCKGDRLAILAYNRLEWAEIYAAAAKVGVVVVPLNFRLSATEILYILEDSGASGLIVEEDLFSLVEEIGTELPFDKSRCLVIGATRRTGLANYNEVIAASSDREPEEIVTADDPWCLMYTSGTTGKPKGAIRSHRGMSMLALMTGVELRLHSRDNALLVMPMCHANSLNFFTAFVHCGAQVSIFSERSFDPALCLRTFASTSATFTSLVPTHYTMMLEANEEGSDKSVFGCVEKLMISSAPAREDTKRAVMEMFPNSGLYELYGSTEAGWVTMLHPHEQFDKLGSVGREVVGSAPILLLDDAGVEVPDGQPGELYSSSPYSFDGYWNRPEATQEATRGDYLSVGDIAIRDADGFIRLVDRKKNIIISGGENIYPSEVETVLAKHPAIIDVAVVGAPDDKWGESVAAAVVLRKNQQLSQEELISWSKARLAGFKCPQSVMFLAADEMPRNTTGKILHRELRTLFAEER